MSYSVSANPDQIPRTGTVTIAELTFTVNQDPAAACTYAIAPVIKVFTASGGMGSVTVTASAESCPWTATSSVPWMVITSGESGTGSGTIDYSVSANTTGKPRIGTMTVAGKTCTVWQRRK